MKLFNILCSICIIAVLAGCSNRSKNSSFFDIFVEGDTVVSTLPYNYLTNVKKLNDSYLMPISSYKDILELYEKLEYTPEAWQSGIREIPRVYLTIIGDKWGTTTSKEISLENKKRLFYPLLCYAEDPSFLQKGPL